MRFLFEQGESDTKHAEVADGVDDRSEWVITAIDSGKKTGDREMQQAKYSRGGRAQEIESSREC